MATMNKTFDITGIGVSVLDTALVVDRLPDSEDVIRASHRSMGLGGGVSVALATAGLLGGRVALADSLGDDVASESIIAELQRANVDLSTLQRTSEETASVASILVEAESGNRTIVYSPGTAPDITWNDAIARQVASSKILHLNGRHLNACRHAIEVAKTKGVKVSFDGGAHRYRDEVLPLVEASDVLIVAEHFAKAHSIACDAHLASDSPEELITFLQRCFPSEIVAVTCGERGSWIGTRRESIWHQSAITANPVRDTTGCGDTYHGAFLMALAKGLPVKRCGEIASIVAASNAEHLGALAFSTTDVRARIRGEIGQA